MENILSKDFIPKKDTQQEDFLKKYPEYDGRGIKIAIIDSGVDVSLDGLQKTSTSLSKIIDCFDFTESGHVDTSTIRRKGNDVYLAFLSGRKIKIPQIWKNPSDNWHLGIKNVKEIVPSTLNKSNEENKDSNETSVEMHENGDPKREKENSILPNVNEENIDCIVWNDGQKWQACIIHSELKNLKDAKVITNFRDSHEYCFILDNVACCVTIHNDGNLLELHVPSHHHGSSVAQVAAAHFPGQSQKDGLAPGAQIVSINLVNEKSNMLTLVNALNKCIEMEVDIINFSIGSANFDHITIVELLKTIVNQHGIIVVKNTGNDGPFISSIRNSSNDEIYYIGSIFSNDVDTMFEKDVEDFPPFVWNYSSRGPLSNGARGVTAVVPADAIVKNPRWDSTKKRIFDGTSCAAPNAAGAIACLLSGLKAHNIKYSPAMIKMALSNTAFLPDGGDQLGFGNGIIQINSAFEYFFNFKNYLPRIVFPQISLDGTKMKGIVIYKTQNNPLQDNYTINENNQGKRIPWILKLSPENHNHIEHSKTVTNNSFNIKIDTTNLQPGDVYYSEIHGFHPLNPSLGPIFHLPITVIIPENVVNYNIQKEIFVQPPSIFHCFIDPAINSFTGTVKLINAENNKIEFEQVVEKYKHLVGKRYSFKPDDAIYEWRIDIKWNIVLEICVYQKIYIERGFQLKYDLQIFFDHYKFVEK